MYALPSTISQNRIGLEVLRTDLAALETDLSKYEKTRTAGLFSEQITASFSKTAITKASRVIGRMLRFRLDKEQVELLLTDVVLDINRFFCAAIRNASKLLIEKASALYEAALDLLPGSEPIQLSLFGRDEYKVIVDKPTARTPRKRHEEVQPLGIQLRLF